MPYSFLVAGLSHLHFKQFDTTLDFIASTYCLLLLSDNCGNKSLHRQRSVPER